MKRSIQSMTLVGSFLVAMGSNLLAEEVAPVASEKKAEQAAPAFNSVLPEGQTLPQNLIRARVVTGTTIGNIKSYDKDSKQQKSLSAEYPTTAKRNATASTLVLEYGILNNLTAQVAAPFILQNSINTSSEVFGKTVEAEQKGKTGLGDMEAGALFNFLSNDMFVLSAGLGMRFPTGQYAEVPSDTLASGAGAYDLGLRLNADFQPVTGLWLSLQDQEEVEVYSLERKESETTKVRSQKQGLSRKSFAQAAFGLGALSQSLKALSVKGRYAYQYDAKVKDHKTKEITADAKSQHALGFGGGIDGRGYNIPVSLDALYMIPVAGTNVQTAQKLDVTLSAYVQI